MALDGHDIEWMSQDDGNDFEPLSSPSRAFSASSRIGSRLSRSPYVRSRKLRRILGGLAVLVMLVTVAKVGGRDQLTGPPDWLQNRPLAQHLSPFMAAECWHRTCRATTASATELRGMRDQLTPWFFVSGRRIVDQHRDVRGMEIKVIDGPGDELIIDAVRVSQAPTRWDGEWKVSNSSSYTRRWVVHKPKQVWLTESRFMQGAAPAICDDHADSEHFMLHQMVLSRVPPDEIEL